MGLADQTFVSRHPIIDGDLIRTGTLSGFNMLRSFVVKNFMRRLVTETEGQDLIEYALLAALIALAAITAMQNLGTAINTKFGNVSTQLGS